MLEETQEKTLKKIYSYALDVLARRDHSVFELQQKISLKFPNTETKLLHTLFEHLTKRKYLNDHNFCQQYIRYRKLKYDGPFLIAQKLKQKGIDEHIINQHLNYHDHIWDMQASELLSKKTKLTRHTDKTAHKLYNLLYRKGYLPEQIKHAIEQHPHCLNEKQPD